MSYRAWKDRERFVYATTFVGFGVASLIWHWWGQVRSTPWMMVAWGVGIAAQRWMSWKPLVTAAGGLFVVGLALAGIDHPWKDPVMGLVGGLVLSAWWERFMRRRGARMPTKYPASSGPDGSQGTA